MISLLSFPSDGAILGVRCLCDDRCWQGPWTRFWWQSLHCLFWSPLNIYPNGHLGFYKQTEKSLFHRVTLHPSFYGLVARYPSCSAFCDGEITQDFSQCFFVKSGTPSVTWPWRNDRRWKFVSQSWLIALEWQMFHKLLNIHQLIGFRFVAFNFLHLHRHIEALEI